MEKLRSLANKELALTAAPPHSSNRYSPDYRVNRRKLRDRARHLRANCHAWSSTAAASTAAGVVEGGVDQPWADLLHQRRRHRQDLPIRRLAERRKAARRRPARPPGLQADRRRGEARQPAKPGRANAATSKSSRTSSTPKTAPSTIRSPEPNGVVTAQQFFLSDTPCAAERDNRPPGNHRRSPPAQHPWHLCQRAQNRIDRVGAPDALLLGSPPDPAPGDEANPALYDYANDPYLEPTPDTRQGAPDPPATTPAAATTTRPGTTHPESQIHRWVTDPVPSTLTEGFKMTGNVTLEFYSKTLNEASHTGTLCVYLFKRHETGSATGRHRHPADERIGGSGVLDLHAESERILAAGDSDRRMEEAAADDVLQRRSHTRSPSAIASVSRSAVERIQHRRRSDPDHVRPPQLSDAGSRSKRTLRSKAG